MEDSAFFVGPGKCGTSWLYAFGCAHPQIDVGTAKDPGNLLAENPDIPSYERLWCGSGVKCDFSNTYIFSAAARHNILRNYPTTNIFITIRHPVGRLVSQYAFMKRNGRFKGSIHEAIEERPDIVARCKFHDLASAWLDEFPPENITILNLETLRDDPETYRTQLCRTLGISAAHGTQVDHQSSLPAAEPRSATLSRATKRSAELVRKLGGVAVVDHVKRSPLPRYLYRTLPQDYQKQHISAIPLDLQEELTAQWETLLHDSRKRGVQVI